MSRAAPLPPSQRRDVILQAVIPLLAQRGRAATSKELATAAGVAEGTIWKAFRDKDDLFAAALDRVTDPGPTEQAIGEIDPGLPLADRLVVAADLIQRRLVDLWSLFATLGADDLPADRRSIPDSEPTIALFDAHADELRIPPDVAARHFRALVLAFSHPVLSPTPPSPIELVEFFLHGVGSRR